MPKEYDVKRNYYADLELPATASVEDAKKQYKKLALQYHPDRNAGKELECIPKFQAIQAAHEILGDPAKKILYDADRRKQTIFGGNATASAPAPRGNPYQATSNFPPPPRRTQPGEYKRPPSSQPRPQSNGANRFSGFAGAPPPPPPRPDPAQDRTNMFRAWQNMNNAQDKQQNRAHAAGSGPSTPNAQNPQRRPQPPPREDTKFPMNDGPRPFQPRPSPYDHEGADDRRSARDSFNKAHQSAQPGVRRSNTNRTPRKQGFDPNAPGSDERPASGSYYVHRHRSEDFGRPFETTADRHTSPRTARRPNIDPTKPSRPLHTDNSEAPFAEANRRRTPYTSFIGEKTEFSSADLRRSKSTRDTTRFADTTEPSRPRSTSPQSRTGAASRKSKPTSFDLPTSDSDVTPGSDTSGSADGSAFSRTPNFHRPSGERLKKVPSPPSRRFNRDKAPTNDGSPTSDARQKSNMYVDHPAQAAATSSQHSLPKFDAAQWRKNMFGTTSTGVPRPVSVPAWAIPDSILATPTKRSRNRQLAASAPLEVFYDDRRAGVDGDGDHQDGYHSTTTARRSFSFTNGAAPFSPPPMPNGKSASEENINLKFAQPWTGTFEGNGNGTTSQPFSRKSTFARQNSGKNRSTFGQPSSLGTNHFSIDPIPPPPPGPAPNFTSDNTPNDNDAKFADFAFKNPSWTVPPPPSPLNRPSTDTDEQAKATTKSPDNTSPNASAHPPNVSLSEEADEMDIDDAAPSTFAQTATESTPGVPPPPKPIRMVSVPPSQWRQQQAANAHHIRAASSNHAPTLSPSSFKTNLDDLSHVEPLARPTSAGLNLSDLSNDLPFKSQASGTLPLQDDLPQVLNIPSVPVPPPVPQNLSKQTWHSYSTAFAIYLKHFHNFNAQMLRHLSAREALAERKMSQGMAWLEATGDVAGESGANGPTGFAAYAREVKEDVRVREAWSVGCDRHVQAVSMFDQTRERVRRLASGGGLVDR